MEHKKPLPIITVILAVLCLVLAISLVINALSFHKYKSEHEAVTVSEPSVDQPEPPPSVPLSTLKNYANQYGVSIEFLQRFFDDQIVYKDETGIVYADIDESLAKSNYDWSNLSRTNGVFEYIENGEVISIKGIDVSKYQGSIDWNKVKADGVEYAIIRVGRRGYSEGLVGLDESFEQNIKGAAKAGIKVGVYFFSQAVNEEEAIEEANFVLDAIKDYDIQYPVVFDSEEIIGDDARTDGITAAEMTDIAIAFCDTVKAEGYTPMIYGNIKWFMTKMELNRLEEYDKWFAQYFNTPFFPYAFTMWQYTASGSVDGIDGNVDLNICFKDYAAADEKPQDESSTDE